MRTLHHCSTTVFRERVSQLVSFQDTLLVMIGFGSFVVSLITLMVTLIDKMDNKK
ncbi:putative holin-like toxin [Schleiferilactobacillus shenzhenensis]|uniref:putative holin-like toxin n=1 Tax=Schleiferilactobacillus shenzhenensis TaxID=1231337 RepID=UPI0009DCE99A